MIRLTVDPKLLAGKVLSRLLEQQKGRLVVTTTLKTHYDPQDHTIYWRVEDGFYLLLHEAAHCALNHKDPLVLSEQIVQESEAWVWAEEACHLWGFLFNYRKADRYFSTYASHVAGGEDWKVKWRHRE